MPECYALPSPPKPLRLCNVNLILYLRYNVRVKQLLLLIGFFSLTAPVLGQSQIISTPLSVSDSVVAESNADPAMLTKPAIDYYQGKEVEASSEWFELETLRIRYYARQGQWTDIIRRSVRWAMPQPLALEQDLLSTLVAAYLQVKEPAKAREWLVRLLWTQVKADVSAVMAWRREVIRSYVMEGRNEDAQTAMLRYRQDYNDETPAWQMLQAEVLWALANYSEIPPLLASASDPQAQLLRLMARGVAYTTDPSVLPAEPALALQKEAMQRADQYRNSNPLAAFQFDVMAANIARARKVYPDEVANLELAFAVKEKAIGRLWVDVEGDRLWSAYANYAWELSNQAQLILGDFDPWLALTREWLNNAPMQARAMLALVTTKAETPQMRAAAHQALVAALAQVKDGDAVFAQLYGLQTPPGQVNKIMRVVQ